MKKISLLVSIFCFFVYHSFGDDTIKIKRKIIVVWQPSHQTDTGKDFSEAETCNAIVEAAMKMKPHFKEYKVWSMGNENVHHSNVGSNTKIEHTSAIIDGKISGYAYELQEANKKHPQVFIAVHNNGGTKRNAVWGYIHYGDSYESENKILAARLIKAVSDVTNLENRGVLLDSTTGRNDYRCQSTNKLSFYSLDENINTAPYRVLLEIGDNTVSRELLISDEGRKKVGEALKLELSAWIAEKKLE
ncbi:MAG TPA: N-acetylmuramoyl-L-alanine amidase [Chitinophagaceae bacterium]|nr:N-acetylmuramoyl-L-alanine amidase [Chitinophagaceae bacterium]